jgi:hypothetical protein
MSKFTCRMCAGSSFSDPVAHFEEAHPGHLGMISLGDIFNQTKLIYSDRSKPVRSKPAEPLADIEEPTLDEVKA